ncbi:hypothetical protein ABD91_20255 [Lysinibacillus sphaericus]|uniref:hypothetical protein n=1 Tax=Lysinibacillus sphaericus TaxID=1421 RepID=UPI0018CFAE32|nr:hypothetical protein [Lysinibacillus sphaericus]MBG9693084.1 hypothetical protein [Lysinibacillus sphaericus]
MDDLSKRSALKTAINDKALIKLSHQQNVVLNYLTSELNDLSGVTIARNLFYYALGRVLEINIHYVEDQFGHMENKFTDLNLIYRTEDGECQITSFERIISDLREVKPTIDYPLTVVFNFIDDSMEDEFATDFNMYEVQQFHENQDYIPEEPIELEVDDFPQSYSYMDIERYEEAFEQIQSSPHVDKQAYIQPTKGIYKIKRIQEQHEQAIQKDKIDIEQAKSLIKSMEQLNTAAAWETLINLTLDHNLQNEFMLVSAAKSQSTHLNLYEQEQRINSFKYLYNFY